MDEGRQLLQLMLAADEALQAYIFRPNNSVVAATWRNAREAFHHKLEQLYRTGELRVVP